MEIDVAESSCAILSSVSSQRPTEAGLLTPRHERAIASKHYFDPVLAKQLFIAGNDFTMADVTAFAGLGRRSRRLKSLAN